MRLVVLGSFALRVLLSLIVLVLNIGLGVRLVMTDVYLFTEYLRPGFPVDVYGFSVSDRLSYAPLVLNYLVESRDILFLSRFPVIFNEREIGHLVDVSLVVQLFFFIVVLVFVFFLLNIFASFFVVTMRTVIKQAIRYGSYATIGVVVAIVINAVVNWDSFFTTFHRLFFADGTWVFEYSDTLIRLFPEQFWFDAAVLVGAIAVAVSAFSIFVVLRLPYWSKSDPA
jgi:integral membrane protein (TIGR01906 family)